VTTSVLVVDDNALNARLASTILARAGYDVMTAASAAEAMAAVERREPDVVLTDISMPGTNGRDLCVALRQRPRRLRIVAYTALALEEERRAIMGAGFDAIVIKPATRAALLAAVGPAGAPGESP